MKGFGPLGLAVAVGVIAVALFYGMSVPSPLGTMSYGSWQYAREDESRGMPSPVVTGTGIGFGPCVGDVNLLGIERGRSCSVNNGAYAWQTFIYRGGGTITYTRAAYLACIPGAVYRAMLALPANVDTRPGIFRLKPIIEMDVLKTPTKPENVYGQQMVINLDQYADQLAPYEGKELALAFYVYTGQAGGCDSSNSRAYAAVKDVTFPAYCTPAPDVEYRCRDNTREAKSVSVNCAETWAPVDVCAWGCDAGKCKPAPIYVPPKSEPPATQPPAPAPPETQPPGLTPPEPPAPVVPPSGPDVFSSFMSWLDGIMLKIREALRL